jgi:hypothetical protein
MAWPQEIRATNDPDIILHFWGKIYSQFEAQDCFNSSIAKLCLTLKEYNTTPTFMLYTSF